MHRATIINEVDKNILDQKVKYNNRYFNYSHSLNVLVVMATGCMYLRVVHCAVQTLRH